MATKKPVEKSTTQEQIRQKIEELRALISDTPCIKSISWDWKEAPDFDDLNVALWPFGVYVYPDPACEGQDSTGFIFSDRPLSEMEIRAVNCDEE